jgi:hypothetical protein
MWRVQTSRRSFRPVTIQTIDRKLFRSQAGSGNSDSHTQAGHNNDHWPEITAKVIRCDHSRVIELTDIQTVIFLPVTMTGNRLYSMTGHFQSYSATSKVKELLDHWDAHIFRKFYALSTHIPRVSVLSLELGPPTLLSRKRVCPLNQRSGVHTRLRVRKCGSPNSDDWRKG